MKLLHKTSANSWRGRQRHQDGMAVIVVIALLAIVLLYVAGNLRTLNQLGRELKLIEQQQLRRLVISTPAAQTHSVTNPVPARTPAP